MQTACTKFKPHQEPGWRLRISGEPVRNIVCGPQFPQFLGNEKGFRKEFYEPSLPSQKPYLPHSTWLYWSEFGSTMGALSCPRGGKMGVYGVGKGKSRLEPN
jgi:hypothetical protein